MITFFVYLLLCLTFCHLLRTLKQRFHIRISHKFNDYNGGFDGDELATLYAFPGCDFSLHLDPSVDGTNGYVVTPEKVDEEFRDISARLQCPLTNYRSYDPLPSPPSFSLLHRTFKHINFNYIRLRFGFCYRQVWYGQQAAY